MTGEAAPAEIEDAVGAEPVDEVALAGFQRPAAAFSVAGMR